MLNVNRLSKQYDDHLILNQVSFCIEKQSIVGLAGPSGSGKSTLLRCIQGLESPDQGEIHCDESTGFMFQDFQLFPHMNVLDNLTYAPKRCHHQKIQEKAHRLLERLGVANKATAYPSALSGGQKQRVALARSLMMNPSLLLCDEPTSGLDVATIDEVIELLHSVKEMGLTVLIASHDLSFLTAVSDRILLLKRGEIALDLLPKKEQNPIDTLQHALKNDERINTLS